MALSAAPLETAQHATICCANMSSDVSGKIRRSKSPDLIARTRTAHSARSSRVVTKNRPLGTAPRQWPLRPTRCRATAIERGEPMWQTRSTVPTSMPSSSEAVATSTLTWPSLSLRSASRRSLRERLPWWAATFSSPNLSPRWCAMRSASRRVLTNTSVERWVFTSSTSRS